MEKENKPKQHKRNIEQEKAGRDPRGVRINNYDKTMKSFKKDKKQDQTGKVLLEGMINKYSIIPAGSAGDVVIQGTGQPPKYPTVSSLIDVYREYLQYVYDKNTNEGADLIIDIAGFCSFANISRETLNEWEKSRPPAYSDAVKRIKTDILSYKNQLGFHGKIPPILLAMDFNNNHGYVQQQKIDINNNINVQELPEITEINRRLPGE